MRRGRRRTGGSFGRWLRRAVGLVVLAMGLSVLQVASLLWFDPPTSAFMLARQFEQWRAPQAGFALDYRWRDFEAVSPQLLIAVIAAEDQRFATHRGFDLDAIDQALAGGARRGASTISQQLARNLFLWSGRSWLRKGLEAWYTGLIELLLPKRRILELYVNVAEFGDGIYGAEAAARRYFGIPASALGSAEAARLAAVLPAPRRYSVVQPGPHVRQRQEWIQRQARQLGGASYLERCCPPH